MKHIFLKIFKNNKIELITAVIAVGLLLTRLPNFIELFKLQGQKVNVNLIHLVDGQELNMPANKKIAIVFWATWCGPCEIELARINELIKDKKISAELVIAVTTKEDIQIVKKTIHERDYKFLVGIDKTGLVFDYFKVKVTPTIALINSDNTIEWMSSGLSPTLELRLKNFF